MLFVSSSRHSKKFKKCWKWIVNSKFKRIVAVETGLLSSVELTVETSACAEKEFESLFWIPGSEVWLFGNKKNCCSFWPIEITWYRTLVSQEQGVWSHQSKSQWKPLNAFKSNRRGGLCFQSWNQKLDCS